MNTPRQKRRHIPKKISSRNSGVSFHLALTEPEYTIRFARIISEFEHLDSMLMPQVLWRLLGARHSDVAGYIYRTLRTPSIKFDIMRTLLEKSAINANRPAVYDTILSKYQEVRTTRNEYAHGLWYTRDDGVVLLSKTDDDGLGFFEAKEEPIAALDEALAKIKDLRDLIFETVTTSPEEWPQLGNLPPHNEPIT